MLLVVVFLENKVLTDAAMLTIQIILSQCFSAIEVHADSALYFCMVHGLNCFNYSKYQIDRNCFRIS